MKDSQEAGMLVADLKRVLNRSEQHDQDQLMIATSKPSVGARSMCPVQSVGFGFDWEKGKVIFNPERGLVPKTDKEEVYDQAWELMLYIATKPVKRETYEIGQARRIFDRIGYDYMKTQKFMHPERQGDD